MLKASISARVLAVGGASLPEVFDRAKDIGFEAIHFPWPGDEVDDSVEVHSRLGDIIDQSRRTKIEVSALIAGSADAIQAAPVSISREPINDRPPKCVLRDAGHFGVPIVAAAPSAVKGMAVRPDARQEDAWSAALNALLQVRFQALEHGVTVALEMEKMGLPGSPAEARRFFDEVNSPFVGLHLDLAWVPPSSNIVDWILALGYRIASFRISEPGRLVRDGVSQMTSAHNLEAIREAIGRIRFNGHLLWDSPVSENRMPQEVEFLRHEPVR